MQPACHRPEPGTRKSFPDWLPSATRRYLRHIDEGLSLRQVARSEGCHPSTVLRQVRRFEARRDDPLMDEALNRLSREVSRTRQFVTPVKETDHMPQNARSTVISDDMTIEKEARRILRRLCETGAFLAVAPDMEKAVVMRELVTGKPTRTAVVDRAVAHAFVLRDWLGCFRAGRVASYEITAAGRAALKRMLAQDHRAKARETGFAEAPSRFAEQHRDWGEREVAEGPTGARRRIRCNLAESPLTALARRRGKDGAPFLSPELVEAGERLREDFELSQMGPRVAQNWDRFLSGGDTGGFAESGAGGQGDGARAARERVQAALSDLGPGLGDIVLRCCCFLEGLETAEKRMGWSARSGKIVLRIALQRLRQHYVRRHGGLSPMIG